MRTFFLFLALFAFAAVVSGFLTYPAWTLVQLLSDQPIHRVMERVGMLVLAIVTTVFLRRQHLATKEALGYGLPRLQFVRQMTYGLGLGLLLMLPIIAALFILNIRTLSPEFINSSSHALFVAELLLVGLITGFSVAFIEETFCRGAMFAAIKRESGVVLAVLLPSLLYAATHFLNGKLRLANDQVNYWSGLHVTAALFQKFSTPLTFLDSFLALTALGVLLALVRIRTGAIAGSIGLHAGGVAVIWTVSGMSVVNPYSTFAWLVGDYNGIVGWMMLVWISIIAVVYWRKSNQIEALAPTRAN